MLALLIAMFHLYCGRKHTKHGIYFLKNSVSKLYFSKFPHGQLDTVVVILKTAHEIAKFHLPVTKPNQAKCHFLFISLLFITKTWVAG